MKQLISIQEQLEETNAALARVTRTIVDHPNTPSLLATLRSFEKRRTDLEADFFAAAHAMEMDVCSYRIETDPGRPTLQGITSVLSSFQGLFTAVYDALVRGPKQTAKWGSDIAAATSFGFAYTFPGSVGVVLTIENERLLGQTTQIDDAMHGVFRLMKAQEANEVAILSREFGVSAVRLAHQWARENVRAGFGADIEWLRREEVRDRVVVQGAEIARLERTISAATDAETEFCDGELVAVDTDESTFRMRLPEGDIKGRYTDAIGPGHTAELPRKYRAELRVERKLLIKEDEEPVSYFLTRLMPLS